MDNPKDKEQQNPQEVNADEIGMRLQARLASMNNEGGEEGQKQGEGSQQGVSPAGFKPSVKYDDGGSAPQVHSEPSGAPSYASGDNPLMKPLIITLVVVVLGALAFILIPMLTGKDTSATTQPVSTASGTNKTTDPGSLDKVTIDDAFYSELETGLRAVNTKLSDAGMDWDIYRYGVYENTDGTVSQSIVVSAYVGGAESEDAIDAQHEMMHEPVAAMEQTYNERKGVVFSINFVPIDPEDPARIDDRYLDYGYWFGKEHEDWHAEIVEQLRIYYQNEGQYPHSLPRNITPGGIKTKGGMYFESEGWGYIPIFEENANGTIRMGEGGGIESLTPRTCVDYYLVRYLEDKNSGLDVYSTEELQYYRDVISPFPYNAPNDVRNVRLEPDGEPDGIGYVIHNGELLHWEQ